MKYKLFLGFLLAINLSSFSFAQETISKGKPAERPLLFAHLPSKFSCNKAELEKIAGIAKSQQVSIQLNDKLTLFGEILENLQTSARLQNINIRLSNFGNALLHISIIKQADNSNKFVGRIIHPKHGDALIISEENGRYYVTKQKMEFFMVE
jgi:hypothetical protein